MLLNTLRSKIDAIDLQICDLLNQRAKLVLQVGQEKVAQEGTDTSFFRPERETLILEKIQAHNDGPFSDATIGRLFRLIIEASRELQINTYQKRKDS